MRPEAAGTVTEIMPALVDRLTGAGVHVPEVNEALFWRRKPPAVCGHEMIAFFPETVTLSKGAPGVCTKEIMLQNPPVKE